MTPASRWEKSLKVLFPSFPQGKRRVEVLYENVHSNKPAIKCSPSVDLLDELKSSIHINIREHLPNIMISVSVFGNPGLFRAHPLRKNIWPLDNSWEDNKSPHSKIIARSTPILFLPVAGSWLIFVGLRQKCQWSYLNILSEDNKL